MVVTTVSEVKEIGDFTNEYTDDEILTEIDIVEAELYTKYRLPKRSSFFVDDDYTRFYISNNKVYDIVRLQVSVDTSVDPSGWLEVTGSDNFTFINDTNYIDLTSSFIGSYNNKQVRVQYIPKIHNMLATNICALNLIDPTIITDGEETASPNITRIVNRINRYKKMLVPKSIIRSSTQVDFDEYDYVSINQSNFR